MGDRIFWHGHSGLVIVFPVATIGVACEAIFENGYVQRFRRVDLIPLSEGSWQVKDSFESNKRNNEMW